LNTFKIKREEFPPLFLACASTYHINKKNEKNYFPLNVLYAINTVIAIITPTKKPAIKAWYTRVIAYYLNL